MTPTNHPAPESEREAIARTLQGANAICQLKREPWESITEAEREHWLFLADAILSHRMGADAAADPDAWMREDGSAATVNPMIAGGWKGQGMTVVPLYARTAEPLRIGIKSAVTWLLSRAREMNDPNAKAVLNSAAFSLGQDLKYREHELAALAASPPAPALDVRKEK